MPVALIIIGILFLTTAVRGTTGEFLSLIKSALNGQGSYLMWIGAIVIVGAAGYVKSIKGLSDSFLVLMMIVIVLANKNGFLGPNGFFYQLKNHTVAPAQTIDGSTAGVSQQQQASPVNSFGGFGNPNMFSGVPLF